MPAQTIDTFIDLAQQGQQVLQQLNQQLETEFLALQERNLEALQRSTASKQELLERFTDLNRSREQLLTQLGVAASANGVRGWLDGLPAELRQPAEQAWQQLQQSLEEITALNLRNEQVLRRASRNTDQLLSLLRGQKPSNTLYSATGTKGEAPSQNRLGKA